MVKHTQTIRPHLLTSCRQEPACSKNFSKNTVFCEIKVARPLGFNLICFRKHFSTVWFTVRRGEDNSAMGIRWIFEILGNFQSNDHSLNKIYWTDFQNSESKAKFKTSAKLNLNPHVRIFNWNNRCKQSMTFQSLWSGSSHIPKFSLNTEICGPDKDRILVYFTQWIRYGHDSRLHKNMKFSIQDFLRKCDQIRSFLRSWSHLLKESLMENFIFCAV